MGLSLRFILPLFLALGLLTLGSMHIADRTVQRWSQRDLDMRADLVTNAVGSTIESAANAPTAAQRKKEIQALFDRVAKHERIYALGYCDPDGRLITATPTLPPEVNCAAHLQGNVVRGVLHTTYRYLPSTQGNLIIVLDAGYLQQRYREVRKYVFYFFAVLALVVSFITVVIAQLSWRGWIAGMRSLLNRGEVSLRRPLRFLSPEIRPLARDLRALMKQIEQERGVRDDANITWNPQALKEILQRDLAGEEVLIVSNREPYIHVRRGDKIEAQFPASGLVSALEPVMRACSGTWVAHGSGSADRETVDKHDHVPVPPGKPAYQLRRVWLTPEEEKGYYYGFSNEGLWPLCHVAHTRPIFRTEDWEMYVKVNQKFADSVIEETRTENPVILVQDYHFALLPRLIRERLPNATVIMFWHIPWPNPEAFGICPWREEILHGMLGSSILGFHTRFHCNNFIDSVDRFREARIDRETSTISSGGIFTAVRHYPISIEWPPRWLEGQSSVRDARRSVREQLSLPADIALGVGVDRLDYTKGILERFRAVERLLDLQPEWRNKFSFVQIASPSRSVIDHYKDFDRMVRSETDRINLKYGNASYKPIILLAEHHSPFDVFRFFRAADLCFVSSLHDGMNLVAKEFISAREDERGVLILSQFAGASRELPESLIVNPYDTDQCAAALKVALTMDAAEQSARMRSMRNYVKEFNVYRWAGRMLIDAARMRQKNKFRDKLRYGT